MTPAALRARLTALLDAAAPHIAAVAGRVNDASWRALVWATTRVQAADEKPPWEQPAHNHWHGETSQARAGSDCPACRTERPS